MIGNGVCAMSEGRLLVEKRGAAGWLIFDNPAKRNALNAAMWRGIPAALAQFEADPDIRCVVLRGSGTKGMVNRLLRERRRDRQRENGS